MRVGKVHRFGAKFLSIACIGLGRLDDLVALDADGNLWRLTARGSEDNVWHPITAQREIEGATALEGRLP